MKLAQTIYYNEERRPLPVVSVEEWTAARKELLEKVLFFLWAAVFYTAQAQPTQPHNKRHTD